MSFSIAFLHEIRRYEMEQVVGHIPSGAAVLEIGAGTGLQSKLLSDSGFHVTAVDLTGSAYAEHRVFPVTDYDGLALPIASHSVDVVFSSNVLEHLPDLRRMLGEIRRVLRPGGFCLHVMPSTSWRFWSTISAWLDMVPAGLRSLGASGARGDGRSPKLSRRMVDLARTVGGHLEPRRHGEHGVAATELWTFSRRRWRRVFEREEFAVDIAAPMHLYYTGYLFLGSRLSIERRIGMSKWLGSASNLYKVHPRHP